MDSNRLLAAFSAGYNAYWAREEICPYPAGTVLVEEWWSGWNAAAAEEHPEPDSIETRTRGPSVF